MTLEEADRAFNRVCKWRTVFASWQLGTRSKDDPECQAVKDQHELLIMLRVEQSAIARLLIEKGIFTAQEFYSTAGEEAEILNTAFEKHFPGFHATDDGITIDPQGMEIMRKWLP